MPLPKIAGFVGIGIETVYKYHQQWRKEPFNQEVQKMVREMLGKDAPNREKAIGLFARVYGVTAERIESILDEPHGLRRLAAGKVEVPSRYGNNRKRCITLELACLMADHLITKEGKFEDIGYAFEMWMRQNLTSRQQRETVAKNNTSLVRTVLAGLVEQEQLGNLSYGLNQDERDAYLRLRMKIYLKDVENNYWDRIIWLIAGGCTLAQAREELYQALLKQGDVIRAKRFRAFQDRIHPPELKEDQVGINPSLGLTAAERDRYLRRGFMSHRNDMVRFYWEEISRFTSKGYTAEKLVRNSTSFIEKWQTGVSPGAACPAGHYRPY